MSIVFYRGTNECTGNSPIILPQSLLFHQNKVQSKKQTTWQLKSQSHQVIHEENEIGLAFFLFFFLFLYYDVLKKDFKDCFKRRFCFSHEKIRG